MKTKLTELLEVNQHTCVPDVALLEVKKATYISKKRAREEDTLTSDIYRKEFEKLFTKGLDFCIEVDTEEGRILGRTYSTAYGGNICYAFQGIPFAEPPERFEPPVPKAVWSDTLNCTYDRSSCVQGTTEVTGSEDCLYLSVFSPNLTGNASVLFWIHGGEFIAGSISFDLRKPDHFINQNVVLVTAQFRLGIFGFMSTGDLVCPGNLGLKDQLMALDWTRRNIQHFGGNPNNITIGGLSSGAASVGYHLLSPKSKDKFQKAIMNSGNSECLWSYNRNAVQIAFKTGESFLIFTSKSEELVSGLKDVDYKDLQRNSIAVASSKMAYQAK
ncbi:venom carboxylesterase-6-like [Diabrotica undecimpunctata]|uniref:venom carboxylesterase-6-like n=1 Tax=Diabrotica undecimpunctata TaxID=50387 RepID=UPI003B632E07